MSLFLVLHLLLDEGTVGHGVLVINIVLCVLSK